MIATISDNHRRLQRVQEALGRIEARQLATQPPATLNDAEFRVFSQWGEDGLIEFLLNKVPIANKVFVEFGVENYLESNTRFLLVNRQWSGLVMDGSAENVAFIRRDPIYWGYNLKAECSFVTRENINELLTQHGISGDIGLLSIDIDGNDYWVWEAIDCVSPRILVCEYNSLFGRSARVTIPYTPSFTRREAHFSHLYYGASLAALHALGRRKGYSLVGSNRAGNNALFVRDDLAGDLPVAPADAYRRSQFREAHDRAGRLTFADFQTNLKAIEDLEVYSLDDGRVVKIKELGISV
ncbi:MAG: hypothetical protein M3P27_11445 [Acidobacteriota bacterium]|nr:hypothetical protein [Acidobacteriota bacterium]